MFVNFNKVFKEKQPTEHTIPPALLEYFSSLLPPNLRYTVDKNGNCLLVSKTESINVGGFQFAPTDKQRKVLGEHYTINDVLNYCENSQQPIPLKLNKEGVLLINGSEFPIDRLVFNPFKQLKYKCGTCYMYPYKLPEPFTVKLGCPKYSKDVSIKRVPNNSVSVAAFESNKNDVINIKYFVDIANKTIKFNMSINATQAKTFRDIVIATSIYNAFIDGEGTFNNQPFSIRLDTEKAKKFDQKTILFWEKILKIEDALGVLFVPPLENIDLNSIYLVERLFQNLINHRPVRDINKIDSIDTKWDLNNPDMDLDNLIGKAIVLQFEVTENIELFGVKLQLPALTGIFNSVVKEYSITKEGKQKLILVDESEEKKRYTSIICFKTEDEMKSYKSPEFQKVVDLLHEAKTVQEYLQNE